MSDPANNDPQVLGGEHGFIAKPKATYTIVFDDEEQLQKFQSYLKWLKKKYPNLRTHGHRVYQHLLDSTQD